MSPRKGELLEDGASDPEGGAQQPNLGIHAFYMTWIPAFAGMTTKVAGMTGWLPGQAEGDSDVKPSASRR
jgi:hypothetical protein